MESVKEIFVALIILFGSGYAVEKIHREVKAMTIKQLQKGHPSLEDFSRKLTR